MEESRPTAESQNKMYLSMMGLDENDRYDSDSSQDEEEVKESFQTPTKGQNGTSLLDLTFDSTHSSVQNIETESNNEDDEGLFKQDLTFKMPASFDSLQNYQYKLLENIDYEYKVELQNFKDKWEQHLDALKCLKYKVKEDLKCTQRLLVLVPKGTQMNFRKNDFLKVTIGK